VRHAKVGAKLQYKASEVEIFGGQFWRKIKNELFNIRIGILDAS
jgi:hypothetical protein